MGVTERILCVLMIISLSTLNMMAQDSTVKAPVQKLAIYKQLAVPVTLIGAALLLKPGNLDYSIRAERYEQFAGFHTHADDYLQYVPIVAVYGLKATGFKGKNDVGNTTALLVKSELLMTAITQPLKKYTRVSRPDNSTLNSFPSGHTAQAFVAATFLHKEFGKKSVWYSIAGYTCATAVGTMRILNNRHWFSDVVMGAGIGILSTNLVYYTHRYKWSKKSARAVVMPTYGRGPGLYLSYKFK